MMREVSATEVTTTAHIDGFAGSPRTPAVRTLQASVELGVDRISVRSFFFIFTVSCGTCTLGSIPYSHRTLTFQSMSQVE